MNFKLAKSFEEGAAKRNIYKDRSDGKYDRRRFFAYARYSDHGAPLGGGQEDAEQGRAIQLHHHGHAGIYPTISRLFSRYTTFGELPGSLAQASEFNLL